MKSIRCLALVVLCGTLPACAFHHYALVPPPGNTAWTPEAESAVVLVGLNTDEQVSSIAVAGDMDAITLASALFPLRKQNALAIHFRVGETFRLTAFNYAPVYAGGTTRYATFDDLPALGLERSGLYFYGNIVARNGEAVFVENFDPAIVAVAREQYPKAFAALAPVNFEPTPAAAR